MTEVEETSAVVEFGEYPKLLAIKDCGLEGTFLPFMHGTVVLAGDAEVLCEAASPD